MYLREGIVSLFRVQGKPARRPYPMRASAELLAGRLHARQQCRLRGGFDENQAFAACDHTDDAPGWTTSSSHC